MFFVEPFTDPSHCDETHHRQHQPQYKHIYKHI